MQPGIREIFMIGSFFLSSRRGPICFQFPGESHKRLTAAMEVLVSRILPGFFHGSCDGQRKGCRRLGIAIGV
jgi:hypothetical protein